MKVVQVTLGKQYKKGMPQFSNITTTVSMTWEVGEGEEFDFSKAWAVVNKQLEQEGELDPKWINEKLPNER